MSKQQWGHGFHSGFASAQKKAHEQSNFPVGFFFTVKDNGKIERQGKVIAKSGNKYLVKYFSWIDGSMSEKVHPFSQKDMENWDWYQSDKDMRDAIERSFGP